jgi:hypothetical protein
MVTRSVPILLLSALCLAAPAQVRADVYKWVDERGVVNYGDAPPQRAKAVRPPDLNADSVNVVPGIPKEELEQLRGRDAQMRLRQLEREVEELRAREASRAVAPVAESPEPRTYWYPAYGYPAYGYGRKLDRRPDAGWTHRPTHAVAKPLPSSRSPHQIGRAPLQRELPFVPVKR